MNKCNAKTDSISSDCTFETSIMYFKMNVTSVLKMIYEYKSPTNAIDTEGLNFVKEMR